MSLPPTSTNPFAAVVFTTLTIHPPPTAPPSPPAPLFLLNTQPYTTTAGKKRNHTTPHGMGPNAAGFYNCPALWDDLPGILAEAKEGGSSCSLGPQWDASEEWRGLEALYPYLDVFMPNEVCVCVLCGEILLFFFGGYV